MHRTNRTTRSGRHLAVAVTTTIVTMTACGGSDEPSAGGAVTTDTSATSVTTSAPASTEPTSTPTVSPTTQQQAAGDVATTLPADDLAIEVQAIVDAVMAPGAIDWSREGVTAAPTLVRAGVRMEGRADLLVTSGTRVDGSNPDTDDPFYTATLTGSLSRTIALQLIDEGLLDPAATVDAWAPDMPGASTTTVQQLVEMRTGWTMWSAEADGVILDDLSRVWTLAEVVALVSADPDMTVAAQPTVANTTVLATDLILGHVLQEVTGQSLPDLVRARIADPLGLERTSIDDGVTPIEGLDAGVFAFDGTAVATSDFDGTSYLTWQRATYASISSVRDLLDLLDAWVDGSLFTTDRTPGAGRFGADRVANAEATSYIGLGVPFNGYCPCTPEGDGHSVRAIGRSPGGIGTDTHAYRYADGITVVVHFNSGNSVDRSQVEAVADRIHEAAAASA